jgi:hypothetical protein
MLDRLQRRADERSRAYYAALTDEELHAKFREAFPTITRGELIGHGISAGASTHAAEEWADDVLARRAEMPT